MTLRLNPGNIRYNPNLIQVGKDSIYIMRPHSYCWVQYSTLITYHFLHTLSNGVCLLLDLSVAGEWTNQPQQLTCIWHSTPVLVFSCASLYTPVHTLLTYYMWRRDNSTTLCLWKRNDTVCFEVLFMLILWISWENILRSYEVPGSCQRIHCHTGISHETATSVVVMHIKYQV